MGAPADKLLVGVAYYGHTWFIPNLGSNPPAWGKYGLAGKFNESGCCEPRATYGGPDSKGMNVFHCVCQESNLRVRLFCIQLKEAFNQYSNDNNRYLPTHFA